MADVDFSPLFFFCEVAATLTRNADDLAKIIENLSHRTELAVCSTLVSSDDPATYIPLEFQLDLSVLLRSCQVILSELSMVKASFDASRRTKTAAKLSSGSNRLGEKQRFHLGDAFCLMPLATEADSNIDCKLTDHSILKGASPESGYTSNDLSNQQNKLPADSNKLALGRLPSETSVDNIRPSDEWICAACTSRNAPSLRKCDVCRSRRTQSIKQPSTYVRKKKAIDIVSPEGKIKVLHQTEEESSNTCELVKEELFSHKTNDEEPGRLSISTTTSRKEKSNDMTRSSHRHRGHTVRYYEDDISPETDLGSGDRDNDNDDYYAIGSKRKIHTNTKYTNAENKNTSPLNVNGNWICVSCTLENLKRCKVCDMCGESRVRKLIKLIDNLPSPGRKLPRIGSEYQVEIPLLDMSDRFAVLECSPDMVVKGQCDKEQCVKNQSDEDQSDKLDSVQERCDKEQSHSTVRDSSSKERNHKYHLNAQQFAVDNEYWEVLWLCNTGDETTADVCGLWTEDSTQNILYYNNSSDATDETCSTCGNTQVTNHDYSDDKDQDREILRSLRDYECDMKETHSSLITPENQNENDNEKDIKNAKEKEKKNENEMSFCTFYWTEILNESPPSDLISSRERKECNALELKSPMRSVSEDIITPQNTTDTTDTTQNTHNTTHNTLNNSPHSTRHKISHNHKHTEDCAALEAFQSSKLSRKNGKHNLNISHYYQLEADNHENEEKVIEEKITSYLMSFPKHQIEAFHELLKNGKNVYKAFSAMTKLKEENKLIMKEPCMILKKVKRRKFGEAILLNGKDWLAIKVSFLFCFYLISHTLSAYVMLLLVLSY